MKDLIDIIKESIFDIDSNDTDLLIHAHQWAKTHCQGMDYEISNDVKFGVIIAIKQSTISFRDYRGVIIEKDDFPRGVKIEGNYSLRLQSCSEIDMSAFGGDVTSITIEDCKLNKFIGKLRTNSSTLLHYDFINCNGNNTKWMQDGMYGWVNIKNCSGVLDFSNFDMNNAAISIYNCESCTIIAKKISELKIQNSELSNIFNNIKIDNYPIINILDCNNLKDLKDISSSVQRIFINNCDKLESLKGLEDTVTYSLAFSECPNLNNSDYLPITLTSIDVSSKYTCWDKNEITQKYPHILSINGISKHKIISHAGKIKVGNYGAVRTAARSRSMMGATRGSLVLDKIKKIGNTVIWEKCKSRSYEDFEMMDDSANPKKNWDYIDPNGFNDCTGVGIEVGDEIVVYCASGAFGRSNGVSRDVVIGFTPKMVKTKNNGNRPSYDICILRPHHIAKDFFDK